MSDTTPEANALTPAVQEASQSLATTTLDASLSSPPVEQEPAATTVTLHDATTKLESGPAVVETNVDTTLTSYSNPVITESERGSEHATTLVVALEKSSATPAEPEQSGLHTETIKVESASATVPEVSPGPMDSVPAPETSEPAVSAAHTQSTRPDPRPTETTSVPVVNTTLEVHPPKEYAESEAIEKSEVVEPQNKLTQKFTEAEWKALKEFRTELPDVFADAYPDQPKARETSITLWGVPLDPTNPKSDARVSIILMKFLRARHLSVSEARSMLVNTLRWRESFNVKASLVEDYPKEIFGNVGFTYGYDKERRPVTYNVYGGNQDLKAVFGDTDRFLRWRVALMEKAVAQLDFNEVDQTVQIHDYAGVSISSRDAKVKAAANEASNIFQSHYPELLYKKFFVNVPTVLTWIFWAFKPLVSAETLAKMSVVGTGKSTIKKALLPYMDVEEIPSRYGGDAQAF